MQKFLKKVCKVKKYLYLCPWKLFGFVQFFDLPSARRAKSKTPIGGPGQKPTRAASPKRTKYNVLPAGKPGRCVPRVNLSPVCSGIASRQDHTRKGIIRPGKLLGRVNCILPRAVQFRTRPQTLFHLLKTFKIQSYETDKSKCNFDNGNC